MDQLKSKLTHGGDIYTAKERLSTRENPPALLDFSANINPLGLPEGVRQSIIDSIDRLDAYPDPLCRELTCCLSAYEGVSGEWLICGNGAADLIFRAVYAVRPKKAMVMAPTFAEYEEALHAASCRVIHYKLEEEDDFRIGEELLDVLEEDLDMLFLCNPNNPTGQLISREFAGKVLERCRELGVILFMDECFNDFLDDPEEYSLRKYLKDYDNLIILKAFTKIYSMAGIRLGHCMINNKRLKEKIRSAGQPWSVSIPAQIAGIQAAKETEYLQETKKMIRRERDFLVKNLKEIGMTVIGSNANYLFLKDSCSTMDPLHERLFEKGIVIRNCDNYHGLCAGYYRICIKKHRENEILIEALREIKS